MRMYDNLESNDCWIADNHTFDIQSYDKNGNIHRPFLTAFLNAKSCVMTSWNITESPKSLKRRIKNDKLPCDYEIREIFAAQIDSNYNLQAYGGEENCKDAIREFSLYRWDEKAGKDAVIKENDHAMDDIRYFCYIVL